MKSPLPVLACVLATSAFAGSKPKTRVIDGKEVTLGPAFEAGPLVEIRRFKAYACTLAGNDAPCTVVTGYAVAHVPNQNYVVTLDISMYENWGPSKNLQSKGVIRVVIDRPKPGVPTPFVGLGEEWYWGNARGEATGRATPYYAISAAATPYKRPKPPPPVVPER